ncbi:DUF4129 domain-containing protein [Pseudomonas abieticivorans]|uniref:DUF4129 domain-containing protein n=1 Tax=Pseudomonas abieticivorans TaxID=2931382 RepID=UPI0020BE1187|nr:DUF4129 domain-containing protein [Pseudomonas sp. PIA16]
MRLTDTTLAIRPRSPWEALDLGVLLAQRHRRLLMLSWAIISLPVFAALSLVFWDSPTLAVVLFWWLKPLFERLPLYILSQALFEAPPTLGQALRQWPRLLKAQWLPSLLWRRFSLSRSFSLPVQQLEGLAGPARQRRLAILRQRNGGAARWLTLVGCHLEMALWAGLMSLLYLLLPQQIEIDWNWHQLIATAEDDWLWLGHLTNLFYALVLVLWEPIYVACGFTLYLNRRTLLEAWDIELVLRSLRARLGASAVLLLALGLGLGALPPPVLAADTARLDSPRLLNQAVTSQASQQDIKAILAKPPFSNPQTVTRWRLGDETAPAKPTPASGLRDWFNSTLLNRIAQAFEFLLWGALIGLVGLVAWHYRQWLQAFVGRRPSPANKPGAPPEQLFGLEVRPDSLPADIAASAEQLWASQPREALGLLYRGLLSRLLRDYQLPLKSADTEGQILTHIDSLRQPQLSAYSARLTRHWQDLAYGHRLPAQRLRAELCQGWRELFDPKAQP